MATRPKCILVMRHGEKPDDASNPNLSEAGYTRANELATYIPETFGKPDYIFAAAISKDSARPYETVKPLAKTVGVPIDATIADQDYAILANDLLSISSYADKLIVVCWHHGNIPSLLHTMGAASSHYPDPWDPSVFNLIIRLDFSAKGSPTVTKMVEPF